MQFFPFFLNLLFKELKTLDKLFIGSLKSTFWIHVDKAGIVNQRKEYITEFGLHPGLIILKHLVVKFLDLFFNLVEYLFRIIPVKSSAGSFVLYSACFYQSRERLGNPFKYRFFPFFQLQLFPVYGHLFFSFGHDITEHMGVSGN